MAITFRPNHQYFAPAEMKASLTKPYETITETILIVTGRVNSWS